MRLAHLILVHSRVNQLERLIKRLIHPSADIFLQVDAKTEISDFEHLGKYQNVYFIKNRVKVYWGNYSVVQATLNAMEEIVSNGVAYSHINLLSGQDYLLKSNDHIVSFFLNNAGKDFMMSVSLEREIPAALERVFTYQLGDYRIPGIFRLQKLINFIIPKRCPPLGLQPHGLSQWMTITPESATYVMAYLKRNQKARRYFRMTGGPDEFIFQTILIGSPHSNKLVNDNQRHIRFQPDGVHPVNFRLTDAQELLGSDKLFARKFDEKVDLAILTHLDSVADFTNARQLKTATHS
jgi:hypothetical protein